MDAISGHEKENNTHKILTDTDVKRKAIRSVISHMLKKLPPEAENIAAINEWATETEDLLDLPEFNKADFYAKRKQLDDIIERTVDGDIRFKLRDSWFSLGKAIEKKMKLK